MVEGIKTHCIHGHPFDDANTYVRPDGSRRCRTCSLERSRAWKKANPERQAAHLRRYQEAHREQTTERMARWRAANPARAADIDRRWKRANRAKVAEGYRRWREANPDYHRDWRQANKDRLSEQSRHWRRKNPERSNQIIRRYQARKRGTQVAVISVEQLAAKMAYHGNRCVYCGAAFENIEHAKPLARGGAHLLCNLRPSCAACNLRKGSRWDGVTAWAATRS